MRGARPTQPQRGFAAPPAPSFFAIAALAHALDLAIDVLAAQTVAPHEASVAATAFHTDREAAKAAGTPVPEMPTVDPAHLADLVWIMHNTRSPSEATYPERLSDR